MMSKQLWCGRGGALDRNPQQMNGKQSGVVAPPGDFDLARVGLSFDFLPFDKFPHSFELAK